MRRIQQRRLKRIGEVGVRSPGSQGKKAFPQGGCGHLCLMLMKAIKKMSKDLVCRIYLVICFMYLVPRAVFGSDIGYSIITCWKNEMKISEPF